MDWVVMNLRRLNWILGGVLLCSLPLLAQTHPQRHARYPKAPSNDPQLILPADQAQSCFAPDSMMSGYEQYEEYDTYPQPASKGYLCIAIPPGRTFVIDHLFAEADYDADTAAAPEWYLDTMAGGYEAEIGFAADRVGSITSNPHYLLSQVVHLPVTGGTRVTLIMHNFYVNTSSTITETPGTASLTLVGHWE
jgi:hypothetical protein